MIDYEQVLIICNYKGQNNILKNSEWSFFIDWYSKLISFIFNLKIDKVNFVGLENGFCVDINAYDVEKVSNKLEKETNKYILESFGFDNWNGYLYFHPRNIDTIKYFDVLLKCIK